MIFAYDFSEYEIAKMGFQNEKLLNESCTDMDKAVQCELDTTDIFIGRLKEELLFNSEEFINLSLTFEQNALPHVLIKAVFHCANEIM